jgi:hypothetical protein
LLLLHIESDHRPDDVIEVESWAPAQYFACFGRVCFGRVADGGGAVSRAQKYCAMSVHQG